MKILVIIIFLDVGNKKDNPGIINYSDILSHTKLFFKLQ